MTVSPNSIVSPQTPVSFTAVATAAETAFNAPTSPPTLVSDSTDNTSGLRITSLVAINRNNNLGSAVNCQLYKKVGSTYTMIASASLASGNPSASVTNQSVDFGLSETSPLVLGAGVGLAVAIGSAAANGIVFRAHGGAY